MMLDWDPGNMCSSLHSAVKLTLGQLLSLNSPYIKGEYNQKGLKNLLPNVFINMTFLFQKFG